MDWSAATSKRAKLVLDAFDMALWRRDRARTPAGPGLVHHSDAGSQHTSFAFTAHLLEAGIDASVGTVGDALDNALMESQIGLYKAELIKPCRPWRGLADVELERFMASTDPGAVHLPGLRARVCPSKTDRGSESSKTDSSRSNGHGT
ncbi:hypothetical protein [Streptomyces afghaniensis]|uniref:hypothetical protein n=1 Tax=Streptomyces afghaniensis TaxID=66865 RepID=UPI00358E6BC5